jgi:hypothetical protein
MQGFSEGFMVPVDSHLGPSLNLYPPNQDPAARGAIRATIFKEMAAGRVCGPFSPQLGSLVIGVVSSTGPHMGVPHISLSITLPSCSSSLS